MDVVGLVAVISLADVSSLVDLASLVILVGVGVDGVDQAPLQWPRSTGRQEDQTLVNYVRLYSTRV